MDQNAPRRIALRALAPPLLLAAALFPGYGLSVAAPVAAAGFCAAWLARSAARCAAPFAPHRPSPEPSPVRASAESFRTVDPPSDGTRVPGPVPPSATLPVPLGDGAGAPFLVRLLAVLALPFEEKELVAKILAAFQAETGARGVRLIACDRPGGAPVYARDSGGGFLRRPSVPAAPDPDCAEVSWRIALPLGGAPVGWLILDGGVVPESERANFETAAALCAVALLAARQRIADGRQGLSAHELDELALQAGATACAAMKRLAAADRTLFLYRRGIDCGGIGCDGLPVEPAEAARLLARVGEERREPGDELVPLSGPFGIAAIDYDAAFAVRPGRDRAGTRTLFLCLRATTPFRYDELRAARLVAGLTGRLFGGMADLARLERAEGRRRLLADFTRRAAAALAAPERTEPLDELLALLAAALPARLLALLPEEAGVPAPCSLGAPARAALDRFLGETNTRLWLRDASGPLDLRDIGPAREPARRLLAELGADPERAALVAYGRPAGPHLLVVADAPHRPLPLPDDRLEKMLLDFARLLAEAAAVRARREAERAEREKVERLAAVGEMAAGVAHEIRNPLGGIELYASSLLAEERDERRRGWLSSITGAVRKLNRIVGDLLLFARDERIALRPVPLAAALAEAVALLEAERAAAHVRIEGPTVEAGADDPVALADPTRLHQILLNVIRNALEAAGKDGIIRLHAAVDGAWAVVRVEDGGPGVAAEVERKIFDPFFTTRANGTGLGLPISLKLAERMGGSLALVPSSLGGAGFELRLARAEEVP